ncbi:MAG: hypothetical protein KC543_13135 [Myxococcales bacterium]|nr:hypothetical protein [Myxococcales bacterium]
MIPARRGVRAAVLALALLAWGATLSAQSALPLRGLGVRWVGGVPQLSFSAREMADRSLRSGLDSGLRKRIVVTVQAYREGLRSPLATRVLECSIIYDLWGERYIVAAGRKKESLASFDEVVDRCLVARDVPVGSLSDYAGLSGDSVYFAVRVELNPIAEDRCRQLLRSGSTGVDPIGPLVINIVRRQICGAERSVEFRSPSTTVP